MPLLRNNAEKISQINDFMGDISANQLYNVDFFTAEHIGILMPIAGPCLLASTPMHKHPTYSCILSFSDTSITVLPNIRYRTQPNTIYLLPPNVPHHEICEVEIPRYVSIFIQPEFLNQQAKSYKQHNLILDKSSFFRATDELLLSIKRFIRESKQPKAGSAELLKVYSIEIVHALLRSMLNLHDKKCEEVSRLEINRSIEYMHQNITEKLTLSILANFAGMSISNYTRTFRKEIGLSPIDYLIEMRLEIACRLLLDERLPLKEIAARCGFTSHAHFSASFQKKYKISPTEYLSSSTPK